VVNRNVIFNSNYGSPGLASGSPIKDAVLVE